MERIDPIARLPGGAPRIEPPRGPDRVHPGHSSDDRPQDKRRRDSPDDEPDEEQGGEHVDVSA